MTIFPVEKWSRLRHFGLSNFIVVEDDVLGFLGQLPPSVRSLELSFLLLIKGVRFGTYYSLLTRMRDSNVLNWRGRPVEKRPRVSICVEFGPVTGRYICLHEEVDEFLYSEGENPFAEPRDWLIWDFVPHGKGTVRDAFEPEHERPWALADVLMRLGHIKMEPEFLKALESKEKVSEQ